MSCFSHAFASVHCCLVVTCWERADLLALVVDVYCIFVTFPYGILGQVWHLIVLIPDRCRLSYFEMTLYRSQMYYNFICHIHAHRNVDRISWLMLRITTSGWKKNEPKAINNFVNLGSSFHYFEQSSDIFQRSELTRSQYNFNFDQACVFMPKIWLLFFCHCTPGSDHIFFEKCTVCQEAYQKLYAKRAKFEPKCCMLGNQTKYMRCWRIAEL